MLGFALLTAATLPAAPPETPAGAVAAALADARALGPAAHEVRYLSLYNVPPDKRAAVLPVLAYHCNALSREPTIVRPQPVAGTGDCLLRVLLTDYGWKASTWERLADSEPYFHVILETEAEKEWPGGPDGDGKEFPKGYRYTGTKRTPALAPWLPSLEAAALAKLTGTVCPVVRADWFVFQTAIQAERAPGYYDFLGIRNLKTFEEVVGFDAKLLKKFPREIADAVANSGVTLQPRALARRGTIGGGYWSTFDFTRRATDKSNPLRVLDPTGGDLEAQATEVFAPLPNGLMAWGLFALPDGTRQDSAPDAVAHDRTAAGNDLRVHAHLSCLRCHDKGGVQDIRPWVRRVLLRPVGGRPPLTLGSPDKDVAIRLKRLYGDLQALAEAVEDDRLVNARAVLKASGLTPEKNSAAYGAFWAAYADAPVSLARAARDLGCTPDAFVQALDRLALPPPAGPGNVDLVLSAFLSTERAKAAAGALGALKESEPIPIDAWHEAYPLAQYAVLGQVPIEKKR